MYGTTFDSLPPAIFNLLHLRGIHSVFRPIISSRARTIAITSNTCVMPPVGMGKAGTAKRIKNKTAKLFSSNTWLSRSSVLGSWLFNQILSSSLKGFCCLSDIKQYEPKRRLTPNLVLRVVVLHKHVKQHAEHNYHSCNNCHHLPHGHFASGLGGLAAGSRHLHARVSGLAWSRLLRRWGLSWWGLCLWVHGHSFV